MAAAGLGLAARVVVPPLYLAYTVHSLNVTKEKQLLYHLNHEVLASEIREFGSANGWRGAHKGLGFDYFLKGDPEVPEHLRALNPTIIRVFPERIEFDFGGAFLSFGLWVFRDGVEGEGTKKLGNGIWFYAEDGRVPSP
jgi:hypothetical protein